MGFLGWIILLCRIEGYRHADCYIQYNGNKHELISRLENWPQDKPLPAIIFRRFTKLHPPILKRLSPADRPGNGWGVFRVFMKTKLTRDTLEPGQEDFLLEATFDNPRERLVESDIMREAYHLSDELTEWLLGTGWVGGPKPYVKLHHFLKGFEPKLRRKPLTPEMLEAKT